jgi:hypothetical protein
VGARYRYAVTLVGVAVCPHPPLLVPAVAQGAAPEMDVVREACGTAIDRLRDAGARHLLVLGADDVTTVYNPPQRGTLRAHGVTVDVALGPPDPLSSPPLPLSLTIAAWLLRHRPFGRPVTIEMCGVASAWDAVSCLDFGAGCAGEGSWALLVMGDGSARRGPKAPGYDDPRAVPYDDAVASALGTADVDALAGLDPVLSDELMVAGRVPWQAMAGAVRATGVPWRGELLYYGAPYGVGYFVAAWEPA